MNCIDCEYMVHNKYPLHYLVYCKQARLLDGLGRVKTWKDVNKRKPQEFKYAERCDLFSHMGTEREIELERLAYIRGSANKGTGRTKAKED